MRPKAAPAAASTMPPNILSRRPAWEHPADPSNTWRRLSFLFEHVLFAKPVPTFAGHALVCQRHALDLAAVAEAKLHRPGCARRRLARKKFAIHPIHLGHVRDVGQH